MNHDEKPRVVTLTVDEIRAVLGCLGNNVRFQGDTVRDKLREALGHEAAAIYDGDRHGRTYSAHCFTCEWWGPKRKLKEAARADARAHEADAGCKDTEQ